MSMTCRRCAGKIEEGQVAHLVPKPDVGSGFVPGSKYVALFVCGECLSPHEHGYTPPPPPRIVEPSTEPATESDEETSSLPRLSGRQLEILQLATEGKVWRTPNSIWALDPDKGKVDVRNIASLLRRHELIWWQQMPRHRDYMRGDPTGLMMVNQRGMAVLAAALAAVNR